MLASKPTNAQALQTFISRNNLPVVGTFQAAGAVGAMLFDNFGGRVGQLANQPTRGDLAKAVREGRRREFAGAYAKYGDEIPDPLAASTAQSAVLDWSSANQSPGRERLALVRKLLSVRQREIIPRLGGDVDGPFGHQAIGQEVAVGARARGHTRPQLRTVVRVPAVSRPPS